MGNAFQNQIAERGKYFNYDKMLRDEAIIQLLLNFCMDKKFTRSEDAIPIKNPAMQKENFLNPSLKLPDDSNGYPNNTAYTMFGLLAKMFAPKMNPLIISW